jgi:hypothetical protein
LAGEIAMIVVEMIEFPAILWSPRTPKPAILWRFRTRQHRFEQ